MRTRAPAGEQGGETLLSEEERMGKRERETQRKRERKREKGRGEEERPQKRGR